MRLYEQIWRDRHLAGFYSSLDMVRQLDGTANLITMSLGGPDRSASSGVSVRQAIMGAPVNPTDIHFDTWLGYLDQALRDSGAPEYLVPEAVAAFETYCGAALNE